MQRKWRDFDDWQRGYEDNLRENEASIAWGRDRGRKFWPWFGLEYLTSLICVYKWISWFDCWCAVDMCVYFRASSVAGDFTVAGSWCVCQRHWTTASSLHWSWQPCAMDSLDQGRTITGHRLVHGPPRTAASQSQHYRDIYAVMAR